MVLVAAAVKVSGVCIPLLICGVKTDVRSGPFVEITGCSAPAPVTDGCFVGEEKARVADVTTVAAEATSVAFETGSVSLTD